MKGKISNIAKYALERPSAIREIMNLVTDFKEHPEKYPRELIYLAGGWPQDAPPSSLREAIKEVIESDETWVESTRYGATRGQPGFIKALVKYEKEFFGRTIDPNEVIVGSGSTELTAAILLSILDEGDEVIITKPSYLNYVRQLQIETRLGVKIKEWPIVKDYAFQPSVEDLKELVTDKTKLIILTTPGNPDSQVFPDDIVEAVVDLAEEKGIWVILDAAYRAFVFDEMPRYYSRPRRENEIWIMSMSKEFRIPGWRLAYAIMDKDLLKAVETVEQARNLCPSRLIQEAFIKLFEDDEKVQKTKQFFESTVQKYRMVAEYTYNYLKNEIEGLRPMKPKGGFYVFFDASNYLNDSRKLTSMILQEYQVALVPGLDFGMEGWIRLSFAPLVDDKNKLEEGLSRLKSFFDSMKK